MKKLKKLQLKDARELTNQDMKGLKGGIDQKEYCCQLLMIAEYNKQEDDAAAGWWYGWSTYCAGGNFTC